MPAWCSTTSSSSSTPATGRPSPPPGFVRVTRFSRVRAGPAHGIEGKASRDGARPSRGTGAHRPMGPDAMNPAGSGHGTTGGGNGSPRATGTGTALTAARSPALAAAASPRTVPGDSSIAASNLACSSRSSPWPAYRPRGTPHRPSEWINDGPGVSDQRVGEIDSPLSRHDHIGDMRASAFRQVPPVLDDMLGSTDRGSRASRGGDSRHNGNGEADGRRAFACERPHDRDSCGRRVSRGSRNALRSARAPRR